MHGLYWLTANLAAHQPVLIVVDDAHWADAASLRWLAYLAGRLEGPELAVLAALRPAEPVSQEGALLAVRSVARTVRPALLSPAGVAALVRATLGAGTPDARCDTLLESSGGNPFYLGELLRAETQGLAAGRADPGRVSGPVSDVIARQVEARIRRLDPAALGLARALAVLGDGGQVRHAAALAGLDVDAAIQLAAGLVRVEVLATADPPCFLHPIVRAAVETSLGSDERHAGAPVRRS